MQTASGGPIYWLRKRLYNNIEPFGYNDVGSRLIDAVVLNKNEHDNYKENYSDPEKTPAQYQTIDNIWGEYLHIPEKERKYSNGKYRIKNNGDGTFSLPFESMDDIMQAVNSSNNSLLWGQRGKLGNSVIGEYDVHRGYDKNGDYLKYIDHWRINPYDVKEDKKYGQDNNSLLKWYFKGKDDASFGLGTPVEIQGKYYLDDIYNVKGKDRGGHYLPEITVTGKKKQGGKMNILEFLKNGSGIHIKEKNKGKFTSYCGGKVTDECIQKGKNSSNPAIRKRATFAANARKWKHKEGGIIKAQEGTKFNWQSALTNVGTNLFNSYLQSRVQNNKINSEAEAAKAENEVDLNQYFLDIYQQELAKVQQEEEQKNKAISAMNDTVINSSPLVTQKIAYDKASKSYGNQKANQDARNKAIDEQVKAAKSSVITDAVSGVIQNGLGMLKDYYGSKNNNTSTTNTPTTFNSYFNNSKYKKFGTFNPDGSMNIFGGTFTIDRGYKPNQPQLFSYQPLKLNV